MLTSQREIMTKTEAQNKTTLELFEPVHFKIACNMKPLLSTL